MMPPVSPTQHSNNNGALNREGGGGEGASSDLEDGVVGGGGSEEGEAWAAQESLRLMACQVIFRVEMQRSMSCDTLSDCLLALVSCCFWGKEQKNQGMSAPVVFRMNLYQCRHLLGIQGHDHAPFWKEEW